MISHVTRLPSSKSAHHRKKGGVLPIIIRFIHKIKWIFSAFFKAFSRFFTNCTICRLYVFAKAQHLGENNLKIFYIRKKYFWIYITF